MCIGCYEGYGEPKIVNERVLKAAELIKRVYDHCPVGGNLHVQIDDWNIDDEHFAKDEMEVWHATRPEQLAAERACYAHMRGMSEDERASALAIHDGFFDPENEKPAQAEA